MKSILLATALLASSTATAFNGPKPLTTPQRHTGSALQMSGGAAPALKPPAAMYEGAAAAGAAKAAGSWSKIFKLGMVVLILDLDHTWPLL